jgi:YfiH family protein
MAEAGGIQTTTVPSPGSERAPLAETSALLEAEGFRHGFFGRRGGVSPSPWASLNFAASTGDKLEHVYENLDRAGRVLGVERAAIFFPSQIHGVAVVELDGTEDRGEVILRQADATLSAAPGVACGVRSADCGTVLLAHPRTGTVAAVHAGWRGAVQHIVGGVVELLSTKGIAASELVASTGPMIEACCFEVGDEVAAQIVAASPEGEALVDRGRAKPHVDLRAMLAAELAAHGVRRVDHVRGCTVCQADRYFSYRREGQVSGRMLSAIVARTGG